MREIAIGVLLLAACVPAQQGATSAETDLVAQLRARGVRVVEVETVEQPFFTGRARVIRANDEDVQIYEFRSAEAAAEDAAKVAPNGGSIGTTSMHWMAAPHFHRKERWIAIHLGDDRAVREALTEIMGPQFAGQ